MSAEFLEVALRVIGFVGVIPVTMLVLWLLTKLRSGTEPGGVLSCLAVFSGLAFLFFMCWLAWHWYESPRLEVHNQRVRARALQEQEERVQRQRKLLDEQRRGRE